MARKNPRSAGCRLAIEPLEDRRLLSVAPGVDPSSAAAVDPEVREAALVGFHGPDLVGKDGPLADIGFDLALLYNEHLAAVQSGGGATFTPSSPIVDVEGVRVRVDAVAQTSGTALRADLESLGMQVAATSGRLVSGSIAIDALDEVAALATLGFARPVYRPITHVGLITTQGDAAMLADVARTMFNVDGTGITVGVLSDSYDTSGNGSAAADVASGDLSPVNVLQDSPGGTDEGRAMLQLIHDVAPGASLQFATANGGEAVFADNIRALANAGSQVIVDDIGYFAEPYFQDGLVAQAVDEVVADGVAYFSAAGNLGRASYERAFTASNQVGPIMGGGLHDFNTGAAVDTRQRISVPIGGFLAMGLQWDQPFGSLGGPGSQSDIDFILFGVNGTTVVTASIDDNIGGDPIEILGFFNDGTIDLDNNGFSDTEFNLGIELAGGPAPGLLKYISFAEGSVLEYDTQSGTAWGHPNSETGAGVGASAFFFTPDFGITPPRLNDFSSLGSLAILFDDAGNRLGSPEIRQQPSFTGPDGGNTTFFGSDILQDSDTRPNFFGTSAAAPHVAAVAALMLEAAGGPGSLAPAAINALLASTAIDINAIADPFTFGGAVTVIPGAGYDFFSGAGLVDAVAAVELAATPGSSFIISVGDVMLLEGDTGTTDFVFTLTLTEASPDQITVEFATADGTATAGEDYIAQSGTVTFAPGELTQTITIAVNGDNTVEPNETFRLLLTNAVGAVLERPQATGTILNDDLPPPSIQVADVSLFEGDSGLTNFLFVVSLSNTTFQPVEVAFTTTPGSASASSDYQFTSGTITIAPGALTATVTVPVVGDFLFEPNETFFLDLTSATGGTLLDTRGTGLILNDDFPPEGTVYVDDVTVTEDASGTKNALFTVAVVGTVTRSVVVAFSTADGTATAGADYLSQSGTLTFFLGNSTQTIAVPILSDAVDEPNETFFLNLVALQGNVADTLGVGTIVSARPQSPEQIVDDGDSGYTPFGSWPSVVNVEAVQLDYVYSARGSGADRAQFEFIGLAAGNYQVFTHWIAFSNRATDAPYTIFDGSSALGAVRINQQQLPDDDFAEGTTWESLGTYTIDSGVLRVVVSDDANGFVVADAVRIVQGGIPAPSPEIDVASSGVSIATGDATPSGGDGTDFGAVAAATGSASRDFTIMNSGNAVLNLTGSPRVAVTGDPAGEFRVLNQPPTSLAPGASATFQVLFAPLTVGPHTAQLVITSNDASEPLYTFTIGGTATAGGPAEVIVDDGDFDFTLTGTWQAAPNTLAFGQDYRSSATGSGSDRATWQFLGLGVGTYDVYASWVPFLNRATNATYSILEQGALRGTATVNQQQLPNDAIAAGVNFEFLGSFSTSTGTLTVALGDNANGFVIADAIRLVKQGGPAPIPVVSITSDVMVAEGDSGGGIAQFTVTLSAPSSQTTTVAYATSDTSAGANDYIGRSGTLTFLPGTTSQTVSVQIIDDVLQEADETFSLNLSTPTRASLGRNRATGTIIDADVPWQNAATPPDVSGDGLISPLDVIMIINRINLTGSTQLAQTRSGPSDPFYDVDGDRILTPRDAIIIINYLNASSQASAVHTTSQAIAAPSPAIESDGLALSVDASSAVAATAPAATVVTIDPIATQLSGSSALDAQTALRAGSIPAAWASAETSFSGRSNLSPDVATFGVVTLGELGEISDELNEQLAVYRASLRAAAPARARAAPAFGHRFLAGITEDEMDEVVTLLAHAQSR